MIGDAASDAVQFGYEGLVDHQVAGGGILMDLLRVAGPGDGAGVFVGTVAVSKVVMPASKASRTACRVWASSMSAHMLRPACQVPIIMAESLMSLFPGETICIADLLLRDCPLLSLGQFSPPARGIRYRHRRRASSG
jgi:hypothetical protein